MFWVIQENFLTNEAKYQEMLCALERMSVPHAIVKMIPFSKDLEPDINPEGKVFCVGGTSMGIVAAKKGWEPGYIGDNLEYDKLLKNYGDLMLNSDASIGPIGTIEPKLDFFFLRPCNDRKSFAGQMMTTAELKDWQKRLIELGKDESSFSSIKVSDVVVCAKPKEINLEWRFFVVDGKPITASMYKRGGEVRYDANVDERVWDFAKKVCEIWCPNRAFALDVCETADNELKVMEINSICSAGFYALDMFKFVAAIEEAFNVSEDG